MSFSILILTLNEEVNLAQCLESVRWCDDVVVLDSFSTDRTEEIARAHGAGFYQRHFDNFAGQRNYALAHLPFKYDWVFHLDADERFTSELRDDCAKSAQNEKFDGYYVASKMIFMGRWLKHAASYPAFQMRFLRRGQMNFIQYGHGQRESDSSRTGYLAEALLHYSFNKGLDDWCARHDRYSSDEARLKFEESFSGSLASDLCSANSLKRRRALKRLSMRLPFRHVLKFIYLYLLKGGFLDGRPGFVYCVIQSFYEYMIVLKSRELRESRRAGSP